jgi:hypothetical protein
MASTRLHTLILVSVVLAAVATPVGAVPVISTTLYLTDRFASNPLASLPDGDFAQISASISGVSTLDPFASLSVEATQGPFTEPLNYFPFTAPIVVDPVYLAFIPFAGAPTGSWSITATDSTGTSAPALTPPIANPALIPFVTGITVSNTSTTPTVSWTLPNLTGFDVDQARIRVIDATTEVQLFQTALPTATTSFTVPGGILTPGGSYIYRVSLEDLELDAFGLHVENRSNAFSDVSQPVPEPATLTLMLTALTSIGGIRLFTRTRRSHT